MISKPILKQTIRENRTLWLIITSVLAGLMVTMSVVLSPEKLSTITNLIKETPLGESAAFSEKFGSMGSFLGLLSQNYYGLIAIILAMLYVIIVANKLVASQVDRGSLAYTLSTPTKRNTFTFTQAAFLSASVILMWLVITVIGVVAINRFQSPIFDTVNTIDVKAAAKVLEVDKSELTGDLRIILEDEDAVEAGAEARGIDEDSYITYLHLAIERNAMTTASNDPNEEAKQKTIQLSLEAAADTLDVELSDLMNDLMMIKTDQDALNSAADAINLNPEIYEETILNRMIAEMELAADEEEPFSVENFLYLNLGMVLLLLLISGISYFASCTFNLSKNSIALGAGIPLTSYIFKLVGDMSEDLQIFSYLSIHSLFDTSAVLNGDNFLSKYVIMGVMAVLFFALGRIIFQKKDLPL